METTRLHQFRVIVQTGTLRAAAELLGVTHSGLSKSMRALEVELGVTLLKRQGRGITVTDAGRRIYDGADAVLREVERLSGKPGEPAAGSKLRVGTFEVFSTYAFARLARDQLRGLPVAIRELVPGEIEAMLAEHAIDVGISYIPIPRPGIEFLRVASLQMGLFARAGAFQGVPLGDIPFAVPVTPVHGAPSGVRTLDLWPDHRFPRRIAYEIQLMETGLALCRSGLAALFVPRFVAALHNEMIHPRARLDELPTPPKVQAVRAPVYLVKRASTLEDARLKKLAAGLRVLCR